MRRLAILTIALLPLPAAAWDTRVLLSDEWLSAYGEGQSPYLAEHTTISDLGLRQLGLKDIYGKSGSAAMDLVDLNASHFRFRQLGAKLKRGDDPTTLLEERRIPAPAHFTELPDYSYAIHDWLNKNETCPALPSRDPKCHVFATGWLGALNAPHFGTQAERMYKRHHGIALDLAARAEYLRGQLTDTERRAYEDVLKEAELEALVYEGYAQHFLQDRWAMGHMWERWNGGDFAQASSTNVWVNLGIGAIAGLIHGAEAVINDRGRDGPVPLRGVINSADPMSSPIVADGASQPMRWRHTARAGDVTYPGVGDERFNDMQTGNVGAGYGDVTGDVPLDVAYQFDSMMACSKAGWAEVIRTFGENDGGYGSQQVRLAADAPGFEIGEQLDCWDMWATNESLYLGLVDGDIPIRSLGALTLALPDIAVDRANLVRFAWNLWRRARSEPNGTDMARGGIGTFQGAKHGGQYRLPDYVEPPDLNALPETAENGVDKQTIMGVFNRAHADHWCGRIEEIVTELRGSDVPREQEVCQYVADLAYNGTELSYQGVQRRERQWQGQTIRSLCAVHGFNEENDGDTNPFHLDQGYVNYEPPAGPEPRYTSVPVKNWCNKLPVIGLPYDAELRNQNVVTEISVDEQYLQLSGWNFGRTAGRVFAIGPDGAERRLGQADDWSDNVIELTIGEFEFASEAEYRLILERADGVRSVGLFKLRVKEKAEPVIEVVSLDGLGPCMEPIGGELPILDIEASLPPWQELTPEAVERLIPATEEWRTRLPEILDEQRACMQAHHDELDQALRIDLDRTLNESRYPEGYVYYEEDKSLFPPLWAQLSRRFYLAHIGRVEVYARDIRFFKDALEGTAATLRAVRDAPAVPGRRERGDIPDDVRQFNHTGLVDHIRSLGGYVTFLEAGLEEWTKREHRIRTELIPQVRNLMVLRLRLFDETDEIGDRLLALEREAEIEIARADYSEAVSEAYRRRIAAVRAEFEPYAFCISGDYHRAINNLTIPLYDLAYKIVFSGRQEHDVNPELPSFRRPANEAEDPELWIDWRDSRQPKVYYAYDYFPRLEERCGYYGYLAASDSGALALFEAEQARQAASAANCEQCQPYAAMLQSIDENLAMIDTEIERARGTELEATFTELRAQAENGRSELLTEQEECLRQCRQR